MMFIDMDLDFLQGHIRTGHIEANMSFTEEEERDFKALLRKEKNEEPLTEEEDKRLMAYKDDVISCAMFVPDDWSVDDWEGPNWSQIIE